MPDQPPRNDAPGRPSKRSGGSVTVIEGYEIVDKIGEGAMGAVYKARQISMNRWVAMKILLPNLAKNDDFVLRFLREAQAAGKLQHPNIVGGIDAGESNGYHYFAMEYIEGETVRSMIDTVAGMSEQEALRIVSQVASGLAQAHRRGLIHRDIKPGNIMMTPEGVAKLMDLGLAKSLTEDKSLTATGVGVGTPYYVSPEQARGDPDTDARADIYSLGATLYHMVTGSVPYDGPTGAVVMAKHLTEKLPPPEERNPHLSKGICRMIRGMMAKNPADRYASLDELLEDIKRLESNQMPRRKTVPRIVVSSKSRNAMKHGTHRKRRSVTRRKSPVALLLILAMCAGAIVLIYMLLASTGERSPGRTASSGKSAGTPSSSQEPKPAYVASRTETTEPTKPAKDEPLSEPIVPAKIAVPPTAGSYTAVWKAPATKWIRKPSIDLSSAGKFELRAVYDPTRKQCIVYPLKMKPEHFVDLVWTFDTARSAWSCLFTEVAAHKRKGRDGKYIVVGIVPDPRTGGLLIRRGPVLWSVDPKTGEWQEIPGKDVPAGHIAYDSATRSVLIVNWFMDILGSTDPATGESRKLTTAPFGRRPGMTFGYPPRHHAEGQYVFFGGGSFGKRDVFFGETWIYDSRRDNWSQLECSDSPPPRKYGELVYNTRLGVWLLSGGRDAKGGALTDMWILDTANARWIEAGVEYNSERGLRGFCYDEAADMIIAFDIIDRPPTIWTCRITPEK